MHKKHGFTVLELVIVIFIVALILGFSRNFLNTTKQEKTIFGENCLRYVYGEIQKFSSDIMYEKKWLYIMQDGSDPLRYAMGFYMSWSKAWSLDLYLLSGNDAAQVSNIYKTIALAPTTGVRTPTECSSTRFWVSMEGTGNTWQFIIGLPNTSYITSDARYLWYDTGLADTSVSSITGDVVFTVCDKKQDPYSLSNCLEIGKLSVDRRPKKIYYLNCQRIDVNSGNCLIRPVIN